MLWKNIVFFWNIDLQKDHSMLRKKVRKIFESGLDFRHIASFFEKQVEKS